MYVIDVAEFEEPVTLEEARLHLRIDAPAGAEHPEDALVQSLVTAARQAAELFTARWFAQRECELVLDCLPALIHLPLAPVVSIVSVGYVGLDGAAQVLDPLAYRLYAHPDEPEVALDPAFALPDMRMQRGDVRMRVLAGHGPGHPLPRAVVQAMLLTVGHLYTNREDVVTGTIATQLPQGSQALLWPYRRGLGV
jgi:uncharacterized phiE125 gp8 family phage protein